MTASNEPLARASPARRAPLRMPRAVSRLPKRRGSDAPASSLAVGNSTGVGVRGVFEFRAQNGVAKTLVWTSLLDLNISARNVKGPLLHRPPFEFPRFASTYQKKGGCPDEALERRSRAASNSKRCVYTAPISSSLFQTAFVFVSGGVGGWVSDVFVSGVSERRH